MAAAGQVSNDGDVYRYRTRTPDITRSSSPEPVRSTSPSSYSSPQPVVNSGTIDEIAPFEGRILDLLQKYTAGLPLERLNNMLRMSQGSPRCACACMGSRALLVMPALCMPNAKHLSSCNVQVARQGSGSQGHAPPVFYLAVYNICATAGMRPPLPSWTPTWPSWSARARCWRTTGCTGEGVGAWDARGSWWAWNSWWAEGFV